MAKARKGKQGKRATKRKKAVPKRQVTAKKKAASPKKKASPGIGARISEALEIVTDSMAETTKMRRGMKNRGPMAED